MHEDAAREIVQAHASAPAVFKAERTEPALAAFMVLEIVPALGTSIFSFTDYSGLPHAAINWVGLQNYHDLLTGGQTFLDISGRVG